MLAWIGAALFAIVAVATYVFREPLARGQGLIAGGRIGVGCVVAEAAFFLLLGVLVFLYRRMF